MTSPPPNFLKKAPVIIVVCTDIAAYRGKQTRIKSDLYCIQDFALATLNLLLAACDRGLGPCWVVMFDEDKLRDALNIPPEIKTYCVHTRWSHKIQGEASPKKALKGICI